MFYVEKPQLQQLYGGPYVRVVVSAGTGAISVMHSKCLFFRLNLKTGDERDYRIPTPHDTHRTRKCSPRSRRSLGLFLVVVDHHHYHHSDPLVGRLGLGSVRRILVPHPSRSANADDSSGRSACQPTGCSSRNQAGRWRGSSRWARRFRGPCTL